MQYCVLTSAHCILCKVVLSCPVVIWICVGVSCMIDILAFL